MRHDNLRPRILEIGAFFAIAVGLTFFIPTATRAATTVPRQRRIHRQPANCLLSFAYTPNISRSRTAPCERLQALFQQHKSLRQLAQRLSFEQARAFGDDRWLFDSAKQTFAICPEEYGIYAALTAGHASLSVGRTGAYYAPAALAHFLPARIAALEGVPKTVRDAANGLPHNDAEKSTNDDASKENDDTTAVAASKSASQYAAATSPIVEALRDASHTDDDKGEPSWSALGELIFEEQFVQAANYLHISLNATESSHADEVAAILPAIKGHR